MAKVKTEQTGTTRKVSIVPSWWAALNMAKMVFQNPKADIEGVRGANDILKQASIIIDGLGEEAKENPTMTIQDFIIKIKKVYDKKK
jgi:hypothetical protein|tara:strand:- start:217 stop:477 length:261 start_codon:yes stop_codon:yes gene_type:complete